MADNKMNENQENEETMKNEETINTESENESDGLSEETADESGDMPEDMEKTAGKSVDSKEGEKKGFFKKDKKKDKKDELIEELTDKYKRTFAEFDNFRKRSEKEKASMYEIGAKDIIEKILPVVDNFERGFKAVSEEEKNTPFAEGMDKIYKQLLTTLNDCGVNEIEAEGKEFDPNLHNAVMHIEDEAFGDNEVIEVLQKGYMYKESVVRHSMVKVAN